MKIKAMVTLVLKDDISKIQRRNFYKELKKRKWRSIRKMAATWEMFFEKVSFECAHGIIEQDLIESAKESNIKKYNAVSMIGFKSPRVHIVE